MSLELAGITYVHGVKYGKGVDAQGPYYEVEYQIPDWSDGDAFANALLGIGKSQPHRYSQSPNCVCTAARVAGKGRLQLNADGSPSYADGAIITATYRSGGAAYGGSFSNVALDDPGNAHQIDPSTPIVWCTQELDFEVETLAVPNSTYYWLGETVPANVQVQCDVPVTVLSLTFHRRNALPMGLVRSLRGAINNTDFLGAAYGCVWFVGARTTREASTDGTVTQKVQLVFKERPWSWQKMLRPGRMPTDADAWQYIKDASGNYRFPEKDLRPLIQMP